MRPKLLKKEHENWLKENYHLYENQFLAKKLTEMVQVSAEKELKELLHMLPSITNDKLREDASKRILFLKNPVTITPVYVKHCGRRLGCQHKSRSLRASSSRRVIKNRHARRWLQEAIRVEKPVLWFRTLKPGSSYNVKFSNYKQLKNFLDYLYKWNREEGCPNNIALYPEPFKDDLFVHICVRVYIEME